ncbi:MAG: hypothetical protein QME74_00445 [Candidatus Edwardsbacteria bacterium]|nr:hypothetical protein [Candidatus Edwardsbacteria bacterium]
MHKLTIPLVLIAAGVLAVNGCSKKSAPTELPVSSPPTIISGTVTDSLGNPLDSVAIKIKYLLPSSGKTGAKLPKDSVSIFTAQVVAHGIRLCWRTESESGTMQWQVQRSIQVDTGYAVLATLSAMGNSTTPHDYVYTDASVDAGVIYYYRLCSVDLSGVRTYFGPITAGPLPAIADGFPGCRPIPVIGSSQISFILADSSQATLAIRKNGLSIRTLINTAMFAGYHAAVWNGNDDAAVPVPSGWYQATFVIARHDTIKNYTQPIFVNIADSLSTRTNACSNPQGAFSCTDIPVDSVFFMKGPAGEELGSAKVTASVTVYACKSGYSVAAKTITLTRNASNTVNFVLR